ncbi:M15 family metallopeptidase [Psychromonas antarctica]|jgi:LAS superfamily LD-carboxypeptidase LdcB|uniref:M15 family metallopeptidase n=1 Tax=Psychromonas antarctica TaxID=67573 RepID=UPI001EE8F578|nr:M15 family metallopeptidase [Psychromonas antarctica]MCG6202467.1 M15 family metallopeptidase [Psychromonas antarctica]
MLIEQLTGQVTSHLTELGKQVLIHRDVISEFKSLQKAAKKAGFNLQIASGFRSFERQQVIWDNKYSGKTPILDSNEQKLDFFALSELDKLFAILHWSALPGASRHHWGTDFDIYDPNLLPMNQNLALTVSEYAENGYFHELNQWLSENIELFGFYRPYQNFLGGVAVEPWHISYAAIATQALQQLEISLIYDLIVKNNVLGKSLICEQLPMIYKQFICNINQPYNGK